MATGDLNPLPFRTGGEDTPTMRVYKALVSAAGKGGSGPADGLRELWRLCIARAIADAGDAKDLAALQAWPSTMTVVLPEQERFLHLPVGPNDVARRAAVGGALTYQASATGPNLGAELREIDPAFTIEKVPWESISVVMPGRVFAPLPGASGPAFGVGQAADVKSAAWANYSDAFVLRVRYSLTEGVIEIPALAEVQASAILNELLPWHMGFELYVCTSGAEGDGFYLDGGDDGSSLLGATAL